MVAPGGIDEERRRAFERARSAGPARIEDHLPPADDPRRAGTLHELACIELELGWKRGEGGPRVEELLARFPELERPEAVAALAAEECIARHVHGDRPDAAEYAERFAGLRVGGRGLVELLAADRAVAAARARGRLRAGGARMEALVPGARFGRYEILGELGRGAFAVVLRARDPELAREVALKVLRPDQLDDARLVERIRREARAAARLRHPGILPVFEVGEQDGLPFLACELIEGASLEERLDDAPGEPRAAAELVARIADAVHCAHEGGVVHRDLKPANVLLDAAGEPVVADFGLAAVADAGSELTRQGDLLGTPAYMAPEQARGEAEVGARADVYALGVLLYRLLCGRVPFEGGFSSVLRRVQQEEPRPPRSLAPGVPLALETVCLAAMAKEPERRYASAEELALDLRRWLTNRPIRARRPGPLGTLRLWRRRNATLAATGGVALALLALVAFAGLRGVLRERDRFRAERDTAEARLYRSLLGEARAQSRLRETGWWWEARELLRRAAASSSEARDPEELRRLAVELLGSSVPCFRQLWAAPAHEGQVAACALGPRGRLVLSGGADGTLLLLDAGDGGGRARVAAHEGGVAGVAFHPRGQLAVSSGADGALAFWKVVRGAERAGLEELGRVALPGGAAGGLRVEPTSARIAVACGDGSVALFDAWEPGPPGALLAGGGGRALDVAFGAEGRLVAACAADRTLRLWDLEREGPARVLRLWDDPVALAFRGPSQIVCATPANYGTTRVALTPAPTTTFQNMMHDGPLHALAYEGRWLVTGGGDGRLVAWDRSMRDVAAAEPGPATVRTCAAADGRVLSGDEEGTLRLWEIERPPHRAFLRVDCQAVAFGAGRELCAGPRVYALPADVSGEPEVRELRPAAVACLAVGAAGRGLALGGEDGRLRVAAGDGGPGVGWRAHEAAVVALAASGETLASLGADGQLALGSWQGGPARARLETGLLGARTLGFAEGGARLVAGGEAESLVVAVEEGRALEERARLPVGGALAVGGVLVGSAPEGGLALLVGASHEPLRRLAAPGDAARPLAADAEGRYLLSAGAEGELVLWDAREWRALARTRLERSVPTWAALVEGAGLVVVGDSAGRETWLLALDDLGPLANFVHHGVRCAAVGGEGGELLLGNRDGGVLGLALVEEGAPLAGRLRRERDEAGPVRIDLLRDVVPGGHSIAVWGTACSPDGALVATSDHAGWLRVWSSAGGPDALRWARMAHATAAWSVRFDARGERLASSATDVLVHEAASGRLLARLPERERLVTATAFLPDGERLAAASLDGSLTVWELASESLVQTVVAAGPALHDLALGPRGRWLAAADDAGVVRVFDLAAAGADGPLPSEPAVVLEGEGAPAWAVAFDRDGARLAAADETGTAFVWSLPDFRRRLVLPSDAIRARSLSFDASGALLAVGSFQSEAVVWDLPGVEGLLEGLGLGGAPPDPSRER